MCVVNYLYQFQDGEQALLGSNEWEWSPWKKRHQWQKPEWDRSQWEGGSREQHPPRQREWKFVSSQSQEPQAEMGSEALRDGQQHTQPHQGHCGWNEAHAKSRKTYDHAVHR